MGSHHALASSPMHVNVPEAEAEPAGAEIYFSAADACQAAAHEAAGKQSPFVFHTRAARHSESTHTRRAAAASVRV